MRRKDAALLVPRKENGIACSGPVACDAVVTLVLYHSSSTVTLDVNRRRRLQKKKRDVSSVAA
jgi:hypothetical protein